MNDVKTISVALLLLGISSVNAQKKNDPKKHETVQKKPVDSPAKCSNIKEGTFLRTNYPKNLWYMTVKNNVQTEFYNDGKDYIKSTVVFIDDCNYKVIVLEKTEQNNPIKVGDVYNNKVIATQDNYIKINSQLNGEQFDLVLMKVKENKK
ncbi:hypothetical protein ODZ84_02925 [Chryseobacterium fluminis]|uniref:hypothetical protein n=1 Tax=Chryseobacterium fluminis TaxID=2983606 RepID=UPI002258D1AA|nr:hypothetical protein [Chryseobacterium sp. MMS21-Ot14]UZT98540.1 hypothetical protein ODZ84_02925 [Chryseobacterium sp. MMS21-Ot14]